MKRILLLIILTSTLLFSACAYGGGRTISTYEESAAGQRIEQLVKVINDKDKEKMKLYFSEQAIKESGDLDNEIEYLFSFFQGEVKSWKLDKWSSGEKIRNGKNTVMLRSWYTVITDKNTYLFFTIDYITDTINPDNLGLYTLRVIKAEDKATQFTYWQDMAMPGIYKPKL